MLLALLLIIWIFFFLKIFYVAKQIDDFYFLCNQPILKETPSFIEIMRPYDVEFIWNLALVFKRKIILSPNKSIFNSIFSIIYEKLAICFC